MKMTPAVTKNNTCTVSNDTLFPKWKMSILISEVPKSNQVRSDGRLKM